MKIKGFTVMELLVVMVLSAIVISLTWVVWGRFSAWHKEYTSQSDLVMERSRLDFALNSDLSLADSVRRTENGFALISGDSLNGILWANTINGPVRSFTGVADTFRTTGFRLEPGSMAGTPAIALITSDSAMADTLFYRTRVVARAKDEY